MQENSRHEEIASERTLLAAERTFSCLDSDRFGGTRRRFGGRALARL
jgi:hypothetical protein